MTSKTVMSSFSLDEKYAADSGVVLLSGIQALVRALQTRAQLDRQQGLNSGGFVSGYRGSPLGGLDKELWARADKLEELGVRFQPGVNEDLAATAVWGSQQVGLHQGATVDGVFGMWYGKAPGLDRSCDAIRHANAWGTAPQGGVLLVVGDDPAAKSSSMATQSEFTLQDMLVPVLCPSDVQDVLDFAVLGWEMSRRSGLWIGLKAIADHMDSSATVSVGMARYADSDAVDLTIPHTLAVDADLHIRREDTPAAQEQRLLHSKLPAAVKFAREVGLNKWVTQQHNAAGHKSRLGIVTAGKAYRDVREACAQLGLLTNSQIHDAGIEILKLGMTWPLDDKLVKRFSANVAALWVVEEKRAFVEPQLKEILYGQSPVVPISGKWDSSGEALLPSTGILSVSDIARILVRKLALDPPAWLKRIERVEAVTRTIDAPAKKERTPLFCAGCPHNTSTQVPAGSRATAGIGCHYMVQWMDRETDSCTQMGGEGVTWVGEAPFTQEKHIFANLGDGTYFHSGILAIRQAVAARVNITYKVLFNDAVAMTGGQPMDGDLSVADLVAQVRAEGVGEVVVVSDQPELHQSLTQPSNQKGAAVFHRSDLDKVQRRLREVAGVSVLIYEQTCATELRRRRKRGTVADTRPRLVINEAVCDGCGDCSVQSNCVAVEPLETALGLKRKINQTNCNKDLSCATGFCPAFVQVDGDLRKPEMAKLDLETLRASVAAPQVRKAQADILITGVGGTGIVTVSALLAAAARLDGISVRTLDMTGLAQKGGAVFAHVRLGQQGLHSPRIPNGCVDVLVGCDLVSAASNESMELLHEGTQAVVNSHVTPTADFVLSQSYDVKLRRRMGRIKKIVGSLTGFAAEDHIEAILGDAQQANVMLLGFAYQLGNIPLSLEAIEEAIRFNAVAVERNLLAFHLGRIAASEPSQLPLPARLKPRVSTPLELSQLIEHRVNHLTAYQDAALASRYQSFVAQVALAEQRVRPGSEHLTRAVAESYAALLAIKDEYEIARLHLLPDFVASLKTQFEDNARIGYLLAPPLLGDKKRRFGSWMHYGFRLLSSLKGLRNSLVDPFAYTSERKRGLAQIVDYEAVIAQLLPRLTVQNLAIAVALAKLPQTVRGFGHVRQAQLEKALVQQQALLTEFHRPPERVTVFDPTKQAVA